jgi:L-2-hydroxyglutarate oxidase LhgO
LIRNYFSTGVSEFYRAIFKSAYVKDLQNYIPELKSEYFQSEKASGVRALALSPDGKLVDDFVFDVNQDWKSVLHVRNAPSPGATSSLAIARVVADLAETNFFGKEPKK